MTRKSSRLRARQGQHDHPRGDGVLPPASGPAPPPPSGDFPDVNVRTTESVSPHVLPGGSLSTVSLPRSFAEVAAATPSSPMSGTTPFLWEVAHAGDRHSGRSSSSTPSVAPSVYDILDTGSDEEASTKGDASGTRVRPPTDGDMATADRPNDYDIPSDTEVMALLTGDSPAGGGISAGGDTSSHSDPMAFGSPAFNAILSQLQSVTRAASARWELMDRNHRDYMAHFQATDMSIKATSLLTSKMVAEVHDLQMALKTTSIMAADARDLACSAQDESSSLRQSVDLLLRRVSRLEPSDSTARIDECFAAADTAFHAAVDDLQVAASSSSDPSSSVIDVTPNPSPNRHPLFSNVNSRYQDAGYRSDSETVYANARRRQVQVDTSDDSPMHRRHDGDDVSPDSEAAQNRDRVTSPGKDFEYLYDGGDGIPSYLGDHTAPSSPTHRASLLHGIPPHILAWHAGRPGNFGDPLTGSRIMETPDVELLGIDTKLSEMLVEFHYDLVWSWENPRWVQANTQTFGTSGFGPFSPPSTSGPNITEIHKQLANWDKLTDLSPAGWQMFYNKLRRGCKQWKIALMPFEAINLKYECQGHGLCVCGLGLTHWKIMGDALFTILEYLLPTTNAIIYTTITSLANAPSSSPNGYELLWILLKEFIPMFDTSQPAPFPEWPTSGDIFEFGRLVLMYCDLARHRTSAFTDAMKSRLFLNHVKGVYQQLAQPYLALVNTYCPGRDGIVRCSDPLPHHLTVLELARSFYDARPPVHTTGHSTTTNGSLAYAAYTPPLDNVGTTFTYHGGSNRE
jgi:hypothetical protein